MAEHPSCTHLSLEAPKYLLDADLWYPARRHGRARQWKQDLLSLPTKLPGTPN